MNQKHNKDDNQYRAQCIKGLEGAKNIFDITAKRFNLLKRDKVYWCIVCKHKNSCKLLKKAESDLEFILKKYKRNKHETSS